jgi:hypothetical protein
MVDLYCTSYTTPPQAVTLDTVDVVHGLSSRCSTPMQPALGLDPGDERCFLPIHVYDTATSRPVAVLLRPGKTPCAILSGFRLGLGRSRAFVRYARPIRSRCLVTTKRMSRPFVVASIRAQARRSVFQDFA